MEHSLLQRYRRDRRRLIDFILSAGLAAEVRPPPGAASLSDVDLDVVSADYVLERAKSGGVLDLSEASRRYHEESELPVMISSQSRSLFFLISDPEFSGPPPQHIPPLVGTNVSYSQKSCSAEQPEQLFGGECGNSRNVDGVGQTTATFNSHQPLNDACISFGLPTLSTGLSDDDLREAAYEVLLATVLFSGGHVYFYEDKQKEKKPRFLVGLRSKRERVKAHTQSVDWHSEILDIIRVQMEISESLDACIKQGLMRFHSRSTLEHIDVPQIILELLRNIYKSDFVNEKIYTQWQKRQANILEELLHGSLDIVAKDECETLKLSIAKLRNTTEGNFRMDLNERANILETIGKFVSRLSCVPGRFGLPGETCYWTSGYHFNVKLYEKLLFSVFDILEDSQMVEELEEFFSIFRLTWSVLGITQKIHEALYGWVLLRQYIGTGETMLLKSAILQIQKTLSRDEGDRNEEAYMNSLICWNGANEGNRNLSLVHSVLSSIKVWCDSQLQDYHLHFRQNPENFETLVSLATALGLHFTGSFGDSKFGMDISKRAMASELLQGFVESSITAECRRILDFLDSKSKLEGKYHLAVLADDLKSIAEREFSTFTPILCQWYPEAGTISSVLLHKIYGKHLMPFLESVSDLSESVRSVLPAADTLERCLTHMLYSSCGENNPSAFIKELNPYKIGVICRPLLLQWVNAQHDSSLKWTERAILIEDWEPLSSQQRLAASVVEVFRIIEENVDQFFNFNIPMDIIHLRSLLIGIFQSLDTYLLRLVSKLVDKKHLYPNVPALTRYKEALNPFMKKKSVEYTVLEGKIINQLDGLTASKLCVRLNTLHYIREQVDTLEESIKKSWKQIHPVMDQFPGVIIEGSETWTESIDELFTIFDEIRRTSFDASNMICDFIGTRVIFWDMRDTFLFSLYRENVENARLDVVIQQLDSILNHICDLVIETLRDQVILSVCQASMEGFLWILLDGGPSRAFSEVDISMVQEDLNMLKELFIASGDGLPHAVVQKEAKLTQQILDVYELKTQTIIEMLMSASEHISVESDPRKQEKRLATDADTLLRILCHKKDREASKFLKRHYHLPKSSDYFETPVKESVSKSPFISDILKRSSSLQLTEKGQRSFRTMKQKFQEVASEMKYSPW
uniref:GTP-dependent nucleic acid-binding protein engD n=1 Tax=Anthurium amnicola TaxID=1678845 RepID=A0A1D1XXQ8_9ARAE